MVGRPLPIEGEGTILRTMGERSQATLKYAPSA